MQNVLFCINKRIDCLKLAKQIKGELVSVATSELANAEIEKQSIISENKTIYHDTTGCTITTPIKQRMYEYQVYIDDPLSDCKLFGAIKMPTKVNDVKILIKSIIVEMIEYDKQINLKELRFFKANNVSSHHQAAEVTREASTNMILKIMNCNQK